MSKKLRDQTQFSPEKETLEKNGFAITVYSLSPITQTTNQTNNIFF